MSRNRGNRGQGQSRPRAERIVPVEAQVQPVVEEVKNPNEMLINLDDVAYMVIVGRYKNGEPFFTNVNVNDIFTVDGLLDYGKREVDFIFEEDRASKRQEEKGE